jgi:LuxR family maltose regulon positive regulatory protein
MCLLGFARAHLGVGDPAGARTLLAQAAQVVRLRRELGVLPGEMTTVQSLVVSLQPMLAGGASTLTASELRVLALLPFYLSFKEIGQRLGVKATTVKTHALSIYGKLGASSRSEAVDLAVEAGLLERFPT